jgi:hypothetical protein
VEPVIENLRIAQDYVLMQSVLPRVRSQWAEVSGYLAPRFPRAYARVGHLSAPVPPAAKLPPKDPDEHLKIEGEYHSVHC